MTFRPSSAVDNERLEQFMGKVFHPQKEHMILCHPTGKALNKTSQTFSLTQGSLQDKQRQQRRSVLAVRTSAKAGTLSTISFRNSQSQPRVNKTKRR
jgi:hypothetical protein